MKVLVAAVCRLHWISLPGMVLLALLQRTPVLRVVTAAGEAVVSSPLGAVLRSAVATAASLGALHTLAGATQFVQNPGNPVNGTVGQTLSVGFTITGSPNPPTEYFINVLPPGLTTNPARQGNRVPSGTPVITGIPTQAGTFNISVTGSDGNYSQTNTITFIIAAGAATAPSITQHPTAQTVTSGASATFTSAASGTPTPTLQWLKNGTAISGATNATLTLTAAQPGDAASYAMVATNSAGTATSNAATLTVNVAPSITTQPVSQSATAGATVSFTSAASGTPTPTIQWRKNGLNISGATNSTLTLSAVQLGDAASYAMLATNSAGTATSNAATLTVNVVPVIVTQPASQTANAGTTVTLSASASGAPTPSFQWRKDGLNLSGASSATLALTNVQAADAGSYFVVATNSAGSAASLAVTLTIHVAPSFTMQPVSQTAGVGATVMLIAAAGGVPAPSFQWRKNGNAITGATNAVLTLTNLQLADAGDYSVATVNSVATVTGAVATLTVTAGPGITTPPVSQTANAGATVMFTTAANGTPPPTLQWLKNGAVIPGATNAILTLTNVQAADAAGYSAAATNSSGTTTSSAATLIVVSPPTITAPPASQTVDSGATVTLAVVATGVGPFTYEWFKDGAIIPGAAGSTLTLLTAQRADAGSYTVRVANVAGRTTSAAAALRIAIAAPNPGRIINLSILTSVSAAEPFFTVGTVIGGAGTGGAKPLLIRAAGPSLTPLGVGGALADPKLAVFSGATVVAENDNWGGGAQLVGAFGQVGAFAFASVDSRDAAVFNAALPAGAYTMQVGGVEGATGVVIAEIYDASPGAAFSGSTPRLINVSVLKQMGAGNILTAGFVIGGATSKTVLIRVVGPTLAAFGVSGALADPKLELFTGGTRINENDDWGGGPTLSAAFAEVGAFALANGATKDAALLVSLAPGSYTVQASGNAGPSGAALVEVYEVP